MGVNESNAQAAIYQSQAMKAVQTLQTASMKFSNKLAVMAREETFLNDLAIRGEQSQLGTIERGFKHTENMLQARYQLELNSDKYGRVLQKTDASVDDSFDPFNHLGDD
jgi:hypothetical protein